MAEHQTIPGDNAAAQRLVISRKVNEGLFLGSIAVHVTEIGERHVRLAIAPPPGEPLNLAVETVADDSVRHPEVIVLNGQQMVIVSLTLGGNPIRINQTNQVVIENICDDKVNLGVIPPDSPAEARQGTSQKAASAFQEWIAGKIEGYLKTHTDVTLQHLAEQVGVSAPTIRRWRFQEARVATIHLKRLLKAIDTSADVLKRELNLDSKTLPKVKERGLTRRRKAKKTQDQ